MCAPWLLRRGRPRWPEQTVLQLRLGQALLLLLLLLLLLPLLPPGRWLTQQQLLLRALLSLLTLLPLVVRPDLRLLLRLQLRHHMVGCVHGHCCHVLPWLLQTPALRSGPGGRRHAACPCRALPKHATETMACLPGMLHNGQRTTAALQALSHAQRSGTGRQCQGAPGGAGSSMLA